MKLNISNLIDAIYLNVFALRQNIEFQIMATWVHLLAYLSFAINLSPFKLFNAESAVVRTASVKHTNLKSPDKKYTKILFKKKKNGTRRMQRDLEAGKPVWAPKPGAQKSFSVQYI